MVNKYTVTINSSTPKVTNNFELSKTFLNLFRLGKMGQKRVNLLIEITLSCDC